MRSRRDIPLIPLGQLVATPEALAALAAGGESVGPYLARHRAGDYGDVSPGDKKLNDQAVRHERPSAVSLSTSGPTPVTELHRP